MLEPSKAAPSPGEPSSDLSNVAWADALFGGDAEPPPAQALSPDPAATPIPDMVELVDDSEVTPLAEEEAPFAQALTPPEAQPEPPRPAPEAQLEAEPPALASLPLLADGPALPSPEPSAAGETWAPSPAEILPDPGISADGAASVDPALLALLAQAEPERLVEAGLAPPPAEEELSPWADVADPEPIDAAFAQMFDWGTPSQPPSAAMEARGDRPWEEEPPPPAAPEESPRPTPPPLPPRTPLAEPVPVRPRSAEAPVLSSRGDVILGIDLGTTYTCAALVEGGQPQVLASRWGAPMIPSVVTFLPDGRTLVGESALRYGGDPKRTIAGSKRLLGRPFDSPAVEEIREHLPYDVVPNAHGEAAVAIDGKVVGLEEVAAAILREVREGVALQLEGKVNRAVITCPAHFNERQREAVRVAGELAGFYVERVLGEPTAAALNLGLVGGAKPRTILVYDLGGGTFDVSLLRMQGESFEVLATGGDTFLGGLDFDACIADLLVEAFLEKAHIDLRADPVAIARVLHFAERAKRELSDRATTVVQIDHLVVGSHAARSLTVPLRRGRVEEMWLPLVEHTASVVLDVLGRAGLKPGQVDEVLLVGGQSRAPMIQRRMEKLFGRSLHRRLNPDEAIALGAARYAQGLKGERGPTLVDALAVSVGVGLPGGRYKKILERDTPLPAERTYNLRSTRDNQRRFEVLLFQGEEETAELNEPLGVLVLDDLPRGPRGSVNVMVKLRLTADQVLEVSAQDTRSGRRVEAKLATRHTSADLRKKLALAPLAPGQRRGKGRLKSVWRWLTAIFRRR